MASNRSVCGNEDRCITDWGPHYFSPESLSFVRITSRCVWQCDRLRPVACMRTHSCTCGHFTALVFFRCQSCEGLKMVILNTPNEQSRYTHHTPLRVAHVLPSVATWLGYMLHVKHDTCLHVACYLLHVTVT